MSINLGHIISLVAFLASLVMVWINFNAAMAVNSNDIQILKKQNEQMGRAFIELQSTNNKMAVTMERLTTIIEFMREDRSKK